MIIFQKQRLIYNNVNPFNLNSLPSNIKNKIDKIIRINPSTGASYQIWSPSTNVVQFSSLNCGTIYTIESNSTDYNISDDLIVYDINLCS